MNLDAKQTRAFLAVIESGSFEAAAARLHITSSAVSQRVRALETTLGNPLVVRSRPCEATREGRRLLQYLRRASVLEDDLLNDLAGAGQGPISIVIASNADTLATWFFPALTAVLSEERVLLELIVEDLDHTYALLESGLALGCITTQAKPMRTCSADALGTMRYRLVASKSFRQRWFAKGVTRDAARHAPAVVHSRKDAWLPRFMKTHFGLAPGAYPCHYISTPWARFEAIRRGFGYGLVPELQLRTMTSGGEMIDLAPNRPFDVDLYWHAWKVQSPRMERLSIRGVEAARRLLKGARPTPSR